MLQALEFLEKRYFVDIVVKTTETDEMEIVHYQMSEEQVTKMQDEKNSEVK